MKTQSKAKPIVLASSSRYRKALLERLGLPFETWSPGVDESALAGELPRDTAVRLARAKAEAGGKRFAQSWIIGSDQVADLDGKPIGKPGGVEAARRQLRELSGRSYSTPRRLWNVRHERRHERLVTTDVTFRRLTRAEIDRHLERGRSIAREAPERRPRGELLSRSAAKT